MKDIKNTNLSNLYHPNTILFNDPYSNSLVATVLLSFDVLSKKEKVKYKRLALLKANYKDWNKIPQRELTKLGYKDESGARKWHVRKTILIEKGESRPKVIGRRITKGGVVKSERPGDTPHEMTLHEIRRIKYGRLPPTGFKAEINTLDDAMNWIIKYTIYKWDNSNIRENVDFLFFKIFREMGKGLIFKPRDSGKSKSSVAIYALIFANFYNTQLCIVNGSKSKNRIFFGMLKILMSPQFRKDYGDIIFRKDKMMGEIELLPELRETSTEVSDDTSFVVTSFSGIIGSHPFVCWLEDILQSEFKSAESNEFMIEEVHNSIIKYISPVIGGTATRKGVDDLYSKLPAQGYQFLVRKAIKLLSGEWPNESHIIWEDYETDFGMDKRASGIDYSCGKFEMIERPGWDLENLLLQRALALSSFEREMQNNPIITIGQYFKKEWFERNEVDPFDLTGKAAYIYVDPSLGTKSSTSDYFCLLVGKVRDGVLYIVDCVLRQKMGFDEQVNMIEQKARQYNAISTGIESILFQAWMASKASQVIPNVREIHNKLNKIVRIDAMDTPLKTDRIRFFRGLPRALMLRQLLEYNRTPSTDIRKDDFPDALAGLWGMVRYYVHTRSSLLETF